MPSSQTSVVETNAPETNATESNSIPETIVDRSTAWADAMVRVAADSIRDPLRYVSDTVVPNGGE